MSAVAGILFYAYICLCPLPVELRESERLRLHAGSSRGNNESDKKNSLAHAFKLNTFSGCDFYYLTLTARHGSLPLWCHVSSLSPVLTCPELPRISLGYPRRLAFSYSTHGGTRTLKTRRLRPLTLPICSHGHGPPTRTLTGTTGFIASILIIIRPKGGAADRVQTCVSRDNPGVILYTTTASGP